MRLWHDDIRRPPDDTWLWARTNEDAKNVLSTFVVEEISLDHDLGLDGLSPELPNAAYLIGNGSQTGLDLVDWMIANDCVPAHVTIHSLNGSGADRMLKTFRAKGYNRVRYIPFSAELYRTKR